MISGSKYSKKNQFSKSKQWSQVTQGLWRSKRQLRRHRGFLEWRSLILWKKASQSGIWKRRSRRSATTMTTSTWTRSFKTRTGACINNSVSRCSRRTVQITPENVNVYYIIRYVLRIKLFQKHSIWTLKTKPLVMTVVLGHADLNHPFLLCKPDVLQLCFKRCCDDSSDIHACFENFYRWVLLLSKNKVFCFNILFQTTSFGIIK